MLLEELTCDVGLVDTASSECRAQDQGRVCCPRPPETPSSPKVNDRLISGLASDCVCALSDGLGELVEGSA